MSCATTIVIHLALVISFRVQSNVSILAKQVTAGQRRDSKDSLFAIVSLSLSLFHRLVPTSSPILIFIAPGQRTTEQLSIALYTFYTLHVTYIQV